MSGTFCTNAPTQKWYDGDDRLIEVQKPSDPSDVYAFPWLTRYFYDLTMGGSVTFDSQKSYVAYGGIFKTQELLTARNVTWKQGQAVTGSPAFVDSSGQSFDALDRPTGTFKVQIGSGDVVVSKTKSYDTYGQLGLLSSECNEVMQCINHAYDARALEVSKSFTSKNSQPVSANETYSYDGDGRTISKTQAGKGTWTYSYDLDSKLQSSVEPSFSQFTSPATLSYQYYGSGERQSIGVSSSSISGNPLITYSYRTDGRVQSEVLKAVTGSGAAFKISRSYSSAGRFMTQTESGSSTVSQPALSYAYDNYGRATSITMPYQNATVSQFEYEGSPTQGTLGSYGLSGGYTTRNEAFQNFWAPTNARFALANGAQLSVVAINTCNSHLVSLDATQSAVTLSIPGAKKAADGTCPASYPQTTFGYDAAFRSISFSNGADVSPGSYIRQFDNEDHTVTQSATAVSTGNATTCQDYNLTYNWGPSGHPVLIGGSASLLHFAPMVGGCVSTPTPGPVQQESLHWDGDTLLFTTNSAGKLDDLKVDAAADFTPLDNLYTGVTFWDRSPDGTLLGCHSTLGSGGILAAAFRTFSQRCEGTNQKNIGPTMALGDGESAVGGGGVIIQPGTDGYSDGYNVIQGVRAFDPGVGAFTTPDAYAGDVRDPMSLKPFIWDDNNPVAYSDPTGYCPVCVVAVPATEIGLGEVLTVLGAGAAGKVVTDNGYQVIHDFGALFRQKPSTDGAVGEHPQPDSGKGQRINSGPLKPEHGGTGDAGKDFHKLSGGNSRDSTSGDRRPPGSKIAPDGTTLRPSTDTKGARIDVPAKGNNPPETLHYPDPK